MHAPRGALPGLERPLFPSSNGLPLSSPRAPVRDGARFRGPMVRARARRGTPLSASSKQLQRFDHARKLSADLFHRLDLMDDLNQVDAVFAARQILATQIDERSFRGSYRAANVVRPRLSVPGRRRDAAAEQLTARFLHVFFVAPHQYAPGVQR